MAALRCCESEIVGIVKVARRIAEDSAIFSFLNAISLASSFRGVVSLNELSKIRIEALREFGSVRSIEILDFLKSTQSFNIHEIF